MVRHVARWDIGYDPGEICLSHQDRSPTALITTLQIFALAASGPAAYMHYLQGGTQLAGCCTGMQAVLLAFSRALTPLDRGERPGYGLEQEVNEDCYQEN